MKIKRRLGASQYALPSFALVMLVMIVCAPPISAGTSVWDGVYSTEQAKNGQVLYKNRCATCHGDNLGGKECAPALTGRYFFERWASVGDLFQLTAKTMPQTEPASMSPQEYADIIGYVLSYNGIPAGKTKLLPDSGKLKAITIDKQGSRH